jgi:hypothetical protein
LSCYLSPKSVAEGHHQSRGPTPRRKNGCLRSMACGSGAWRQCLVGIKLITDLAQCLTRCRAYNLAEARRLASPVHSPSRAKRRASSRPPRVHVPHCRLATHCETWSERMKHPALRTRRLASHLVETTHGSAELYKPGFSRFNPGKSQYGHIVPAEDRSRGPALTSIGRRSEGAHHQGGAHPGTAEHAGTRRPGGSPRVSLCHRPGEPPRARRPRAADAARRGRAGASALAVADAGDRAADLLYAPAVTSGGGDSPWGVATIDLKTSECGHHTLFLSQYLQNEGGNSHDDRSGRISARPPMGHTFHRITWWLRHEVARLIVWHAGVTRPVVPSAVSYEDVREGNDPYSAFGHGTHSHPTGT